jgi:signal transduction histidine kinase
VYSRLKCCTAQAELVVCPKDRLQHHLQDTGIGIAADHLPHLYDRFWRADPVRSHREGSDLGLAIAHSIVTAHRGSIAIDSQPGKGTIVQVKLPLS